MAEYEYNFMDGILRIPSHAKHNASAEWINWTHIAAQAIQSSRFDFRQTPFSIPDRPLVAHELTHHFQALATACGWYMFKLGSILNQLALDKCLSASVWAASRLRLPLSDDTLSNSERGDIPKYQHHLRDLMGDFEPELLERLLRSSKCHFDTSEDFARSVEDRSLLEIDLEEGVFLFGPEKIKVPVGQRMIMETMAAAVELTHSERPSDQPFVEVSGGGAGFNQNNLMPKWRQLSDVRKAVYSFPLLYCLQFRPENLADSSADPDELLEHLNVVGLGIPYIAYSLLSYVSYFSLMVCVERFPDPIGSSALFYTPTPGSLRSTPGKVFLAALSEMPQIAKLAAALVGKADGKRRPVEVLDFYESMITEISAVRSILPRGKTFEQYCNDFMAELDSNVREERKDNMTFGFVSQSAEKGLRMFEKFWELSYSHSIGDASQGGSIMMDRQMFDKNVLRAIAETDSLPIIMMRDGNSFTDSEQWTLAMLRYLNNKMLYSDNFACWYENNPDLPMQVDCSSETRHSCQEAFPGRSDCLRSFCGSPKHIQDVNGVLQGITDKCGA